MVGKGEGVTAKLTRGLATMEMAGRTSGDDDRRRESTGDGELGTGRVGVRPKTAEIDPHSPVSTGEGLGSPETRPRRRISAAQLTSEGTRRPNFGEIGAV